MTSSRRGASDQDALLPVGIGTIVWAAVLVVLLVQGDDLAAQGRRWWVGVAAVGLASGVGGLVFLWRRRQRKSHGERPARR